jgi:mycofactocin precursor
MPEAVCELDATLDASAPATPQAPGEEGPATAADLLVIDDILVEEISIDGMCGVY